MMAEHRGRADREGGATYEHVDSAQADRFEEALREAMADDAELRRQWAWKGKAAATRKASGAD